MAKMSGNSTGICVDMWDMFAACFPSVLRSKLVTSVQRKKQRHVGNPDTPSPAHIILWRLRARSELLPANTPLSASKPEFPTQFPEKEDANSKPGQTPTCLPKAMSERGVLDQGHGGLLGFFACRGAKPAGAQHPMKGI